MSESASALSEDLHDLAAGRARRHRRPVGILPPGWQLPPEPEQVEATTAGEGVHGEPPTDGESVSEALRALAARSARGPRSEAARLREILDDVEAALAAGAGHAAVLRTLHRHGFTLTAKSFESTLYRLRRERRAAGQRSETKQPKEESS
jgi:hypothetical protein